MSGNLEFRERGSGPFMLSLTTTDFVRKVKWVPAGMAVGADVGKDVAG